MELRRIYLENVSYENDLIPLNLETSKRIIKVLRLKRGKLIEIFWDNENNYIAEIANIKNKYVYLKLKEKINRNLIEENISIAQCILKTNRMDWLIEKITEIGICNFYPIISDYAIFKNNENIRYKILRWKKIMISAVEQSGRCSLPILHEIKLFNEAIVDLSNKYDIIFFCDKAKDSYDITSEIVSKKIGKGRIMLFIGPEGGFSLKETELAAKNNALIVSLPHCILRSETAAITALSIAKYIKKVY